MVITWPGVYHRHWLELQWGREFWGKGLAGAGREIPAVLFGTEARI